MLSWNPGFKGSRVGVLRLVPEALEGKGAFSHPQDDSMHPGPRTRAKLPCTRRISKPSALGVQTSVQHASP